TRFSRDWSSDVCSSDLGGILDPGNALLAVERIYRTFRQPGAAVRLGGRVMDVSATHFRARGLSDSSRLGDIVEFRAERGIRTGRSEERRVGGGEWCRGA